VDGGRDGELQEGFVNCGFGLHVRGEDLGVIAEIHEERVAGPSAFNLYCFEGDVMKEVL